MADKKKQASKEKKTVDSKSSRETKGGLLSVGDIAKMAGVPSNTVHHWKDRYDDFPKPVSDPTSGNLYRRGAVTAWLKKTNRLKG